jgi:hypothetical protein
LTEEDLRRAEARGRRTLEAEPRATAAHYDPATGRVVIELANGCAYAFPAQRVQDLQGASDETWPMSKSTAPGSICTGQSWTWTSTSRLSSRAFSELVLGSRELARVAGRVRSPAKAAAARSNGAKGGRPRKAAKA